VNPFHPDIPQHVAEVIRSLRPDLKRSVKAAVRNIAADQECGELLMQELDGLWKYRVRRFRIVYAIDRKARVILLMAVDHRQSIYDRSHLQASHEALNHLLDNQLVARGIDVDHSSRQQKS
jgi:mRNA interferase RelE/StbE